jgi:glutamate dehydrogenase
LPALASAPDIVMVADRTGQDIAEVAATYFATEAFVRLDAIVGAARGIRALDSIGDAERRLIAAMAGNGAAGPHAIEAWVAPRRGRPHPHVGALRAVSNPEGKRTGPSFSMQGKRARPTSKIIRLTML